MKELILNALRSKDPKLIEAAIMSLEPFLPKLRGRPLIIYADLLKRLGATLLELSDPYDPRIKRSLTEAALYYRLARESAEELIAPRLCATYLMLSKVHTFYLEHGAARLRARLARRIIDSDRAREAEFIALVRTLRLDEAERLYEDIERPSSVARVYYARLLQLLGEHKEAERIYEKSLHVPEARLRLSERLEDRSKVFELVGPLLNYRRPYRLEALRVLSKFDKSFAWRLLDELYGLPKVVKAYYSALALSSLAPKDEVLGLLENIYLPPYERLIIERVGVL